MDGEIRAEEEDEEFYLVVDEVRMPSAVSPAHRKREHGSHWCGLGGRRHDPAHNHHPQQRDHPLSRGFQISRAVRVRRPATAPRSDRPHPDEDLAEHFGNPRG